MPASDHRRRIGAVALRGDGGDTRAMARRITLGLVLAAGLLIGTRAGAHAVTADGGSTLDTATPAPIGAPFSASMQGSWDYYSLSLQAGDKVSVEVTDDSPNVSRIGVCATEPSWLHRNGDGDDTNHLNDGFGYVGCATASPSTSVTPRPAARRQLPRADQRHPPAGLRAAARHRSAHERRPVERARLARRLLLLRRGQPAV
jgi:hypothetical protein